MDTQWDERWQGAMVDKCLTLMAGILILAALVTAARTPLAAGYELSIYEAFPLFFWFLFVGAIACGVGILLHQAFGKAQSRWWVAGFLIIVITNSLFLLLPVFRGYAVYGRYDTLTHLGLIRDIAATGHTGENWYPIEHLLGGSITQVGGLSIESTLYVLFILILGVYVFNLYLIARALMNDHRHALVVLSVGAPLIYAFFHVNIHPMLLSLFIFILVLYGYHRRSAGIHTKPLMYVLLMLIGAFAVVYAHPVTSLFAMVALLALGVSHYLFSKRFSLSAPLGIRPEGSIAASLRASLVLLLAFFVWYFNFPEMESRLESFYQWLSGQGGTPLAQEQVAAAEQAQLAFGDALRVALNSWGAMLLLLAISVMIAAVVGWRYVKRRGAPDEIMFTYAVLFVIGGAVSLAEFFGVGGESDHPERIGRFALLMGTILTGLAAYRIVCSYAGRGWLKAASIGAVFFIVIVMIGMSFGAVYASPRTAKFSTQLTHMEKTGFVWFEENKDGRIPVTARTWQSIYRLQDYLFGVDSAPDTMARWVSGENLPSHLGYDVRDHFSQNIMFQRMPLRIEGRDLRHRYVILTRSDQMNSLAKPSSARPRLTVFAEPDFAALAADPSIGSLYCNGEFTLWMATRDVGGA